MTLQYRSSDGALLRHGTNTGGTEGALMAECCCPSDCNSCDPPLIRRYIATFSGLGGSWVNGATTMSWYTAGGYGPTACIWFGPITPLEVSLAYSGTTWTVTYGTGGCVITFTKSDVGGCSPTGSYSLASCGPSPACDASCTASAAATCTVAAAW